MWVLQKGGFEITFTVLTPLVRLVCLFLVVPFSFYML